MRKLNELLTVKEIAFRQELAREVFNQVISLARNQESTTFPYASSTIDFPDNSYIRYEVKNLPESPNNFNVFGEAICLHKSKKGKQEYEFLFVEGHQFSDNVKFEDLEAIVHTPNEYPRIYNIKNNKKNSD